MLSKVKKMMSANRETDSGQGLELGPSWRTVLFAWLLVAAFYGLCAQVFPKLPPYAYEVCKNLRGLPTAWADLAILWTERSLKTIALAAAAYHTLWQLGTRYRLTAQAVQLERWFPRREAVTVPYASIRKASFSQSLLGLALDSGSVAVDAGSLSGPLLLEYCPKPAAFYASIQAKLEGKNS